MDSLNEARNLCESALNTTERDSTGVVTIDDVITPDVHLTHEAYLTIRDELLHHDVKMKKREATLAECKHHGAETLSKRFFYSLMMLPGASASIQMSLAPAREISSTGRDEEMSGAW